MTNLSVEPSKTIAIVKVICGIFVIGIAMLFAIMGIGGWILFAIMGVMLVVSGICEFYLAKRGREF